MAQVVNKIHLQCGRPGSIPVLGKSPGERKGYQLQYSGLENSMDWGHKEWDSTEQLSLSLFKLAITLCVSTVTEIMLF